MFYIWNKISNEPVTADGEPPTSKNIRLYSSKAAAQAAINQNDFAKSNYEIRKTMKDFNKTDYEEFADALLASEEILYAIEKVTESEFFYETHNENTADHYEELANNAAYLLWEEGGREDEILAALPTEDTNEGDAVCWDSNSIFAEFDGEKWNRKKQ